MGEKFVTLAEYIGSRPRKSTGDQSSNGSGTPDPGSPRGMVLHEPLLTVKRHDEQVQVIEVLCPCGKSFDIELVYGDFDEELRDLQQSIDPDSK